MLDNIMDICILRGSLHELWKVHSDGGAILFLLEGMEMLVLTRRVGEEIVIDGGRIRVIILDVDRGRIRIGIDAPDDVRIDRREVHDRRCPPQAEEQESVNADSKKKKKS